MITLVLEAPLEEIARFLAGVFPFSGFGRDALVRAASRVSIEYYPAGSRVPVSVAEPDGEHRVVVRSGSVELRFPASAGGGLAGRAGEGDALPASLTFSRGRIVPDAVALEDTLVLLVPDDDGGAPVAPDDGLATPARTCGDLRGRPFVACAPDVPLIEAALRMRAVDAALLVVDAVPPALVTDRDLRNHVVASGLPATAPVSTIADATVPVVAATLPPAEALLLLLEAGAEQALVTRGGQVLSVLSQDDLAREWTPVPVCLPTTAEGIESGSVAWLVATGSPSSVGSFRAASLDAIVRASVRKALPAGGSLPGAFAWIALGPIARRDPASPLREHSILVSAGGGFRVLSALSTVASAVSEALTRAGCPACAMNTVASNPLWCRGVDTWRQYLDGWLVLRDPVSAERAAAFLDARAVAGDASLAEELRGMTRDAYRIDPSFRARLVDAVRALPPPLGFFRGAVLERDGGTFDRLDLDARLLEPIASCARIAALDTDAFVEDTTGRLRNSAARSLAGAGALEALSVVFEDVSALRLRAGPLPACASLAPADRRLLERAFHALDDGIAWLATTGEGA